MLLRRANDHQLLDQAVGGSGRAFAEFYRRYLPALLRYCMLATRNREIAADLAAETFAAALAGLGSYAPARGVPAAWLFAIATHKISDSQRRGRVEATARLELSWEPVALTDADLERVDELAESADARERLARIWNTLPDSHREALVRRVVHERSYPEIAGELACSEAVVRQRVSRGLRQLRSRLKEEPWHA